MQGLVVIDDEPDIQWLVKTVFSIDPRFKAAVVAESAEAGIEMSGRMSGSGVIVLDHALSGPLTGFEVVRRLKAAAPHMKIILFSGHADLRPLVEEEPAVDAFVLKLDASRLLPVAQRLTGLAALYR